MKYVKAWVIGVENAIEYRTNLLLVLVSCFFPIVLQVFMWRALYSGSGHAEIYGYSYPQMMLYAVLATVISKIISADYCYQVATDIKSGALSKFLVKPVDHMGFTFCNFIGDKMISVVTLLIISISMLALFAHLFGFAFSIARVLLFVLAILVAMVLKFMISYLFSCMAFWVTESDGILLGINVVGLVISGAYFPLDIFGQGIVTLSRCLPFYYTVYFPVNVISGTLSMPDIWIGFGVQLIWIAALLVVGKIVWTRGLTKYVAVGG